MTGGTSYATNTGAHLPGLDFNGNGNGWDEVATGVGIAASVASGGALGAVGVAASAGGYYAGS
jgi:hypothetical protein